MTAASGERRRQGGTVDRESRTRRRETLRATLRAVLTSAVLVTAYYLLPLDSSFSTGTVLALTGGIAVVSLLLAWQIREITRSRRPRLRAMKALALSAPLYLLLFATVFYLLEHSAPGSFSAPLSRTDSLYFTMTVFSTVGFGDITPRTQSARLLVTGQITANLLLIGVAARLLVAAVQQGGEPEAPGPAGESGATRHEG
ncbi:potassium channel family protein [Streptomyces sp. NPDC002580]|uniref:potassium channel family protein n=1 Tax=Streptomyces sp. NPDC002580 TaxID=3364653 RepID=UPI0036BA2506